MKVTKVLILAKHLDGGTGTFVSQLTKLENLYKGKIKLQILGLEKPKFKVDISLNSVNYFSQVQQIPGYYRLTGHTFLNLLHELIWVKRIVFITKPDVLLAIDSHCNVLACLVKLLSLKEKHMKLVLSIHNNVSAVAANKLSRVGISILKRTCLFLFKQADHVVAVSEGVADDVQNFFSLKVRPKVIYYGLDRHTVQIAANSKIEKNDEMFLNKDYYSVLSLGRFAPQKDFESLIKAFKIFTKKIKNAQLILIGDGEERNKLKILVKKLQLIEKVHFLGWKQNIYPYLSKSKIFVHSSRYEGFGYVLIEAMSLGIPVVSVDINYGPVEILGNNVYGMLARNNNYLELEKAMSKLATDHKTWMRYRRLGKKRSQYFSELKMLNNYYKLFSN